MTYNWWHYQEAGSYNGNAVKLKGFKTLKVCEPKTAHIILEVTENGRPIPKSYKKIIIKIIS
ncbi:hypothetical protein [Autumnicola psychrophila]|uniref:hypothetical protein n=1 Tax=Autumnicola psychrophila TaxID=3075592 RepID=UPI003D76E727